MRRSGALGLLLLVALALTARAIVVARRAQAAPSNVLPADYVGAQACRDCHGDKYDLWSTHAHSRMNANPDAKTVRGDFSGKPVRVPGGEAVFSCENGQFFQTLRRDSKLVRRYVVTRVVGSRFMQFYIGKQVEGPEPTTDSLYSEEIKLPYGYWFRLEKWVPETYFDPGPPELESDGKPHFDPFEKPWKQPWRQSCIACHNTYPYLYRLGCLEHAGYPARDLELDRARLLPELAKNGVLKKRVREGQVSVFVQLEPEKLVNLGVSCESCHFGGRAHAKGELEKPRFGPSSPLVKVVPEDSRHDPEPSRKNPYAVNAICTQCHCAVVPLFPNGAGTWNSREGLDLEAGACATQIRCTDCHDPHRPGPPEASPDDGAQVGACVRCHDGYADPARAKRHSGHADAAQVGCLDCHMPRISQGLEEVVRTHTISSPTDVRMIAAGAPNACNLCHLDKSIRWTASALEKTWGKKIALDAAWAKTYGGSLDAPVGRAWLESDDHFLRVVASQAYARSPLGKGELPRLVAALEDPVPVDRVFAQLAVERVTGKKLGASYDLVATPEERKKQVEAILATLR